MSGFFSYRGYMGLVGKDRAERLLAQEIDEGRENPARAGERLGEATFARPDGPLVWLHAGSEAEAPALPEMIQRLLNERDDIGFLVTAAHEPQREKALSRLPQGAIRQLLPYDMGEGPGRFIRHWRPDVVVWADGDLKPEIIEQADESGATLFLVDAHLAEAAQRRWLWGSGIDKALYRRFDRILAEDEATVGHLRRLGVAPDRVEAAGSLQEGSAPLAYAEGEGETLGALVSSRPVWLAAGVAPKEEAVIAAAHRQAMRRAHRLLLILAPEDPAHGPALAEMLEDEGWVVGLRSRGDDPEAEVQIFIADLPNELGLWLRLSPSCFMGGTLDGKGGSNPFEATALGSAVLHGPKLGAYAASYDRLGRAGAARLVRDAQSLARAVEYLLSPDKAAEMAMAAWDVSTRGAEIMDRVCELILAALDARGV